MGSLGFASSEAMVVGERARWLVISPRPTRRESRLVCPGWSGDTQYVTGRPELTDEQRRAIERGRRLYEQGRLLTEEGLLEDAARAYEESVAIVPSASAAWFNLALMYKRLRRWESCLRANARVLEIDPKEEPAYWNLGIAATALRDWPTARRAWRGYGIEVPDGEGPIEMNFGSAPVRLNPDTKGEVVWARRIDPARAIVRNVPLPDSGFRWGDTVLHDGEPVGERTSRGRTYDVFNVLERWEASSLPTLQVNVIAPRADDAEALEGLFVQAGHGAEDWTGRVRMICRKCSEGSPHEHTGREDGPWHAERQFGLAAEPNTALELLAAWTDSADNRAWDELNQVA
jgi:hypothetical protein